MKNLVAIILFLIIFQSCVQHFDSSPSSKIAITKISNNPNQILKPNDSLKFYFDKVDHPDYDLLLDSIISPGMNEKWGKRWRQEDTWTLSRKLRIWCREFLNTNGWVEGNLWEGDYTREIYSIPKILQHQNSGNDGLCSYYATFFMHSSLAIGINNRRVGWWHPGGDQLNEVYIPKYNKWVAMSPLYNCWYSDVNGPLSLSEINAYKHANSLDLIKTHRDFQTTYPNPEITKKNWLADYSWDIYYWNKNGYLLLNNPKAYRYKNPEYWPYRNFDTSVIIDATQDENLINFDVSLIDVSAVPKQQTIILYINDYSVVNFKEFMWVIKNTDGKVICSNSFINKIEEVNLEGIQSGNYYLSVFANNSRLGKSQTVAIEFNIN